MDGKPCPPSSPGVVGHDRGERVFPAGGLWGLNAPRR